MSFMLVVLLNKSLYKRKAKGIVTPSASSYWFYLCPVMSVSKYHILCRFMFLICLFTLNNLKYYVIFTVLTVTAATSITPPPHIVSITSASALPPAKSEEPMDAAPSQPAPPPPTEVKKGLSKVKGSLTMAKQSIQAVVSQVKVPTSTPSTQPTTLPAAAPAPRLASPLQALEQEEYGTDASASSFSSASKPENPTEVGEQAAPPNLPFRELVQKVREFLSTPDPAAEEDYQLGSALGRDPVLLQQEKLHRPPSIKLPMVADLSRLQTAQDDSVKPSTSNTLVIGKNFLAFHHTREAGTA